MEIIRAINGLYLSQIVTFLAMGLFLDSIFPKAAKERIHGFLGSKNVSFQEFESATITGLIQLLSRKDDIDRISIWKVPLVYLTGFLALLIFGGLMTGTASFTLPSVIMFLVITPIFAWPFDYLSIWVTKKIFYFKYRHPLLFPFFIFLDMLISTAFTVLPVILYFLLVNILGLEILNFRIIETDPDEIEFSLGQFIVGGFMGNAFSSIFINIAQILIVIGGAITRAFWLIGKALGYEMNNFKDYPITLAFTVFSLVAVLIEWLAFA